MDVPTFLPCDGCGQLASPEHISRRLQRLEWATRFRPIHIQALLLAAAAPETDSDFLYSSQSGFTGQSATLLSAIGITTAGKSPEEVLAEFQKRGLVLGSLLECPVEASADPHEARALVEHHLPQSIARIRRSLKPKRILVIAPELQPLLPQLTESALGCPVFFTPLSTSPGETASNSQELSVFRGALPALTVQGA
jgi:hypothetical protein